mgnify:CR=1 FL=1
MTGFSLIDYVREGSLTEEILAEAVKAGTNINRKNVYGCTALDYALFKNNIDLANLLLNNGANAATMACDRTTPLTRAILTDVELQSSESVQLVKRILEVSKAANIDERNYRTHPEETALRFTLIKKRMATAELLIDHGADVRAKGACENTVLRAAVANGDSRLVEKILAITKGENIDEKTELGFSALGQAVLSQKPDIALILLNYGANPAIKVTAVQWTLLGLAAFSGHLQLAQKVLASPKHLPIDEPGPDTSIPLGVAISRKHTDLALFLIDSGASLRIKHDEKTLLMVASEAGLQTVVQRILNRIDEPRRDLYIDEVDRRRMTALHMAISKGESAIALDLINAGANFETPDDLGTTPLMSAQAYNLHPVVERIQSIEARWSPMRAAWATVVARAIFNRGRTATVMAPPPAPGAAPGASSGIVGGYR